MESFPSLSWRLPAGDWQLTTLQGGWGQERQVVTEMLGDKPFVRVRDGTIHARMSAWFSCTTSAVTCGIWRNSPGPELEPGAGAAAGRRAGFAEKELRVEMGLRGDFNGPIAIAPARRWSCPRSPLP